MSYAIAGFIVGGFARISLGMKGFVVGSTLGELFLIPTIIVNTMYS